MLIEEVAFHAGVSVVLCAQMQMFLAVLSPASVCRHSSLSVYTVYVIVTHISVSSVWLSGYSGRVIVYLLLVVFFYFYT